MSCPAKDVADRFVLRTRKAANGCILWAGGKLGVYGSFSISRRTVSAHRAAYELFVGPIPPGMFVLHDCPGGDNPLCVNPAHLWLGTNDENMADMVRKGRQARQKGSRHGCAKLSEADVATIRERSRKGERRVDVAADFGIDPSQVSNIALGKNWRHI